MTKTAKERLTILADFLENKVKPNYFDLGHWATPGFTEQKCGTTACAAGWATVAFPGQGLKLVPRSLDMRILYKEYTNLVAVACFFDIDMTTGTYLFLNLYYPPGRNQKKHVVARIRAIVKTGVTDLNGVIKPVEGFA